MQLASLILAAEDSGEKSGFDIILPKVGELFWGFIAFAVLFILLWKFALPPLKKMIETRTATIEGDLKKAEEAKLEAEEVLAEYRKQLAGAREESGKIIEEARQNADTLRKDVLAKADDQAKEIIAKGERDIETAVGAAQSDLRARMSDLAIELAGRVLGRELDAAAQADTVDDFMRDLDRLEAKS